MAERAAAAPATQTPSAWNDIRLARRAMSAGNWAGARTGFLAAVDLSRRSGDTRTMAIAQLDLARCETMLGNFDGAVETYREILRNPDASPSVGDFAQFEALVLTLLKNDRAAAVAILAMRRIPPDGPVREAINCLSGDLDPSTLLRRLESMPQRFQNDAYLAAALRYHLDGNDKNFSAYLRRCIQVSSPSTDWPAPFAKMLRHDVQD
jgi:tetratricopeptide (TPR) repeat protein